ncbi:hypothetical protein [Paenibacillus piscarius]|uniref:hypothetical protein n=1 Tax=Paenibacillus piscarius TaxID=1089681 RepID=UPI001EE828D8|nr:hypothetical protein [Paenibacillus piscarius]
MKRMLRQYLGMTLGAAMLLALAAPLSAHAAEEITVYDSYVNKNSGVELHSVSQLDGNQFVNAVISKQPDGTFAKWPEPFLFFRNNGTVSLPLTGNDDPEQSYVYDTKSESIVRKSNYILSPDGRWGYLERSRYSWQEGTDGSSKYMGKFNDQYLRDTATGKVTIYHSTDSRYNALWMNQHTLLEGRYDKGLKQNVISTYDPSTGKRKELVKGTLYNWNLEKGLIQYGKNEPKRLPWIYNLKDGTSRLVKNDSELRALFPSQTAARAELSLPKSTVLKDLPVAEVPITLSYEYNVNLDGKGVDVSTVFSSGGQEWIPVKPLAASLGWKIEVMNITQTGDPSAAYINKITNGGKEAVLTPANSFTSGNRLYMTQAQIKELGYSTIKLTPYLK